MRKKKSRHVAKAGRGSRPPWTRFVVPLLVAAVLISGAYWILWQPKGRTPWTAEASSGPLAQQTEGSANRGEPLLAPSSQLYGQVKTAPPSVQEAYRFAIANPDVLSRLPCYCGCGAMGHHSNLDCFVAGTGADGRVLLDTHAFGCGICVDIARDAMRMVKNGTPLTDMRGTIDRRYGKYGPPTDVEGNG